MFQAFNFLGKLFVYIFLVLKLFYESYYFLLLGSISEFYFQGTMGFIKQMVDTNCIFLPTPGEAEAKAMPGRLYIHTINK